MATKKIVYAEVRTAVDDKGVVTEQTSTKVIQFPSEPPFIKLYVSDLTAVLGLPSGAKDLLYALFLKMDFENVILLNAKRKRDIAESVGIKVQTLDNYLQKILDAGLITRISRGEYKVNPNYASRGDWAEVVKKRQEWEMIFTYKLDGTRTIEGRIKADGTSQTT